MMGAGASFGVANAQAGFQQPSQTLREMVARRGAEMSRPAPAASAYAYGSAGAFDLQPNDPNPYPGMRISGDTEGKVRQGIDADVTRLFHAENFLALEKLAEKFRTSDRFTPVGDSKSEAFYEAFRYCHCKHAEEVGLWRERAERYRQTFPKSPTPLLIRTGFLIDDAWYALERGPGGSTVRRLAFRAALAEAGRLLANNWDVVSLDNRVYALFAMIVISSDADRGVFDQMVDRIAAAAPDYAPAWFGVVDGLSPQWRDDPRLIERIARRAATGDDAEGLYARVLHHAWAFKRDAGFLKRAAPDHKLLHASALRFVSQHPDVSNFVMMASFACALQDWDMAEPLLARMQALDATSYADFPGYEACRRDIYNHRHPTG
jgi:hypothetical protein